MKASPAAKPKAKTEEALTDIQKLVWQPLPLRIDRDLLQMLDRLLMESCRDTVDAMVVAYKRTHERELATPGGADQLLAYYSECKEKVVPHYMLELRQGSVQSLTAERNLQETNATLGAIPRGDIASMLITTRGARVSTSLYLSNRLLGQNQITIAGPDGQGAAHLMKLLMDLLGKWRIRGWFVRTRLSAILVTGALQSIYLIILFQLLAGLPWLPVLGMVGVGLWAAMAASYSLAFPPLVFHLGKPPDRFRLRFLLHFLLLNLLFVLAIAAAILFPL